MSPAATTWRRSISATSSAPRSAAITTYGRFNPSAGLTWKFLPDTQRLCELCRGEPGADPGRTELRQRREPVQPRQFLCRRPQPEAGRRAHGRGRHCAAEAHPFAGATPVVRPRALSIPRSTTTSWLVNSPIEGRAFFQNVGSTLRQGVDLDLKLKTDRLLAWIALFLHRRDVSDRLYRIERKQPRRRCQRQHPGPARRPAPRHPGNNLFKLGVDYKAHRRVDGRRHRDRRRRAIPVWRRGQSDAAHAALFRADLHTSYQVTRNLQLFGLIENAFNATYYTYGTFSPTSSMPIVAGARRHQPAQLQPGRPDRRHSRPARDVLIQIPHGPGIARSRTDQRRTRGVAGAPHDHPIIYASPELACQPRLSRRRGINYNILVKARLEAGGKS